MLRTFSRLNPNVGALHRPYHAYQTLVVAQRNNTNHDLPAEIRHTRGLRVLHGLRDTPEQKKPKEILDCFLEDKQLLIAAGSLALELEERARWLVERGDLIPNKDTGKKDRKHPKVEATMPLTIAGDFADVTASVGLYSHYERIPGKRNSVPHLGYLSVHVSGTDTALDKPFSTYASISNGMLDLAHPETAGHTPSTLYGPPLVDGFELRDMLTFVENNAPNSGLPPQRYPSHVLYGPIAAPELITA